MISLEEFHIEHPYPMEKGLTSLFKFFRFNDKHPECIETLFERGELYHSLPKDLNDPFENRPHFIYPNTDQEALQMRENLIKLLIKQGMERRKSEQMVSIQMARPEKLRVALSEAQTKIYSEIRICCFTKCNKNLLLWAHYADSHKGFCVEFDATKIPISATYKIKYQEEYPTSEYPIPGDARAFKPALVKSEAWSYEEEFRSIMYPPASVGIPKTDTGYKLSPDTIKAVYLGENIKPRHQEELISTINKSPFQPKLWKAKINSDSYGIGFEPYGERP